MTGIDAYDRVARLAPAYLVFAPAIVFVIVSSLGSDESWRKIGGTLVALGAPMLAVQWGRAGGRSKQAALFASWGGAPTTHLLRFSTGGPVQSVVERHRILEAATGMPLPTRDAEAADPQRADAIYEAAVVKLREFTRTPEYPLVLKENIAYGFRRNLWGRKPYGVGIAVTTAALSAAFLGAAALGHELIPWQAGAVSLAFSGITTLVWLTVVTRNWVRDAAEAYAVRLLESATRVQPVA